MCALWWKTTQFQRNMANPLDNLKPFQPGQSGNPGGKPAGARNRLTAHFLNALADDFEAHGKQAIIDARTADPMGYVKTVGALMPKQIEQTQPLDELTDAELVAGIALLRGRLANGSGEGIQPQTEPSTAH
jgi:hypothetical protein